MQPWQRGRGNAPAEARLISMSLAVCCRHSSTGLIGQAWRQPWKLRQDALLERDQTIPQVVKL